ncbi:MAG: hypothetical protein AB1752_10390 [Candidatus Zixiibacteriota bacterium]
MKRTLILMVALVLIVPVAAMAGDYHKGVTLNCSECHVMHGAQSHGYNANGGGFYTAVGGAAPHEYLLRNEINELCLTCHDNQSFAPDVLEANGGTAGTEGRIAGALNMNNFPPYFDATGHTLGSMDVAPGGTWSNTAHGLTCVDCHNPHGRTTATNTNPYRNLGNEAAGSYAAPVTYAIGTNDLGKDVFERTASGSDHYDLTNVDYNEPVATASAMGTFCKSCHTDYHGSSSDANMRDQLGAAGELWLRHPTADANIGGVGGGHSRLTQFANRLYRPKVMSPTGDWGTQGVAFASTPTDLTPSCFSCHSSHGNTNGFGIKYITGNNPIGENGDGGTYRETCRACHGQGS